MKSSTKKILLGMIPIFGWIALFIQKKQDKIEKQDKIAQKERIQKLSPKPDLFTFTQEIPPEKVNEVKVLETERLYLIYHSPNENTSFKEANIYLYRKSDKITNGSGQMLNFGIGSSLKFNYENVGKIEIHSTYKKKENADVILNIDTNEKYQKQGLMREALDCTLNHFYKNGILKWSDGTEAQLKSEVLKKRSPSLAFHEDFGFEKCDQSPNDRQDYKMTKEIFNNPEKKENRERKIQERINVGKNLEIVSISSEINPYKNQTP